MVTGIDPSDPSHAVVIDRDFTRLFDRIVGERPYMRAAYRVQFPLLSFYSVELMK